MFQVNNKDTRTIWLLLVLPLNVLGNWSILSLLLHLALISAFWWSENVDHVIPANIFDEFVCKAYIKSSSCNEIASYIFPVFSFISASSSLRGESKIGALLRSIIGLLIRLVLVLVFFCTGFISGSRSFSLCFSPPLLEASPNNNIA